MRKLIGQGLRPAGRMLRRLAAGVLLLGLAAGLGLGVLAWRLDQGPLDLPWLAQRIEAESSQRASGLRVAVGGAALVWEGFRRGVDRPLDVQLRDIRIAAADGPPLAILPRIDLSLSLRALAAGRLVPRGIALDGARLLVERNVDGSLAIELAAADDTPATGARPALTDLLGWALTALAAAPDTDLVPSGDVLSQIRHLQLRHISARITDRALGLSWQVDSAMVDLLRGAGGGLDGTATLPVVVAGHRLALTATMHLPAAAAVGAAAPPHLALAIELPPVVPAEFAAAAPALAPLAAIRLPVAANLAGSIGADLRPTLARLALRLGTGELRIGAGVMPVQDGSAEISGSLEGMQLSLHHLALAARPGATPSLLSGSASLRREVGQVRAELDLRLDQAAFADLPALWPDGVGGPGTKPWITANITDGVARNLNLRLAAMLAPDLSDGIVSTMSGGVEASGMTVHWLRPVPPATGVDGRLRFVSADVIEIDVLSGRQGGLTVTAGRVTLSGLSRRDQYADIAIELGGPVPDLLAVLGHPRVNLLSRRPLPLRNPTGRVEGRLNVLALPLENDLTIDEVRLSANGTLAGLALGGIAAGRDLVDGRFAFEAGNDGLRLRGTASIATIPALLQVEMDFTDGPPTQVLQRIGASATVQAEQLTALGFATPELTVEGAVALRLDHTGRRNGRGELALRGDLVRAGLRAERLNWSKPVGRPAIAELRLQLERDRLAGADRLSLRGEGVDVQGTLEMAAGTPRRLRLSRATLGPDTDVALDLRWPQGEGGAWQVGLAGRSLDASAEFGREGTTAQKAGSEHRGPAWALDLRLDRLVLGPRRQLTAVTAAIEDDGRITRRARIAGRAAGGPFRLSIAPSAGPQRVLDGMAEDAGGLLAALDLADNVRGGRMEIAGRYDDTSPDHPLAGEVRITGFGVRDAPAIGKLLQALTVYGAFEALRGPDLGFDELIAPFRMQGEVIELRDARAFSASLGMTVKGRIDRGRRRLDLEGTIVPAYFINSLLGRIPLIGKLVSPEAGGGLFAVAYGVRGPIDDPSVWVNPLTAVTPGFLRGLFGVFDALPADPNAPPPAPPGPAVQGTGR